MDFVGRIARITARLAFVRSAHRVSPRGPFASLELRWSGTAFFRRAVIAMTIGATQGQHCVEPAVAFDELFVHLVGDYFACAPRRGVTTGSNAC